MDKRKWFLAVFLIMTVIFGILIFKVNVNYNMTDYLPEDSATYEAMSVMFEEFGDGGSASIMIADIEMSDVSAIREKMSAVSGVKNVLWLDTALIEYYPYIKDYEIDIGGIKKSVEYIYPTAQQFSSAILNNFDDMRGLIPDDMMDMVDMMMSSFYKDGNALVQISFNENAYSKTTVHAIDELKKIVTDAGYSENLGGMAASAYAMETIMESELLKLVLILAPIIIFLLLVATSSWFEPIIYLIVIGISIVINMGTNTMLGSVSYLTFSIAALIQVAVSMDYSIFIMHAYKKMRADNMMPVEASKAALAKSLSPVSASSFTTIAGFVALMFMRYKIGMDIGLVLTKGIVSSLITAFLFMPGLLVMTDKLIMKCEHITIVQLIKRNYGRRRSKKNAYVDCPECFDCGKYIPGTELSTELAERKGKTRTQKLGDNLLKLRYVVPLLFILALAPAYIAQSGNEFMYGELASSGGDGSVLMIDRQAIEDVFGSQNNIVVMLDRKYQSREAALTSKLNNVDNVSSAQSYSTVAAALGDMPVPTFMADQFLSEDYSLIVLTVDTGEEDREAFNTVDDIRSLMAGELDDGYYILGNSVSSEELKTINNKDYTITTSLALTFIFIILLLTFRGLVLPLILAVLIQGSIWFAMTVPAFANMQIVFLGYLIVSCFQMGCTIDYGILFSNNYLEARKTNDKFTACKSAFKSSVGAISLSALILMTVGYTVGMGGSIPSTSNIGLLLGMGATVSYIAMTYLLPLFLVLLDKPISATTLRFKKHGKR